MAQATGRGRAARCARHRLRLPGHGHGGGRGGRLERGAVLGAKELQGAGGEDPAGVREPDAAGAPQHSQVPSLLDGHAQRQAKSHLYHRVHVIRVLKAVPKTHQAKCQEVTAAGMEEVVHPDPFSVELLAFLFSTYHPWESHL